MISLIKNKDTKSNRMKIHWKTIAKIQKMTAKEKAYCQS